MSVAIASYNGLKATAHAFDLLQQRQSATDATVEGVTLVEDDPDELTVGYGGLPNEQGVVELDAAVMDGPSHRGGGVAALQDVRHAARVARLVMRQTTRVLLAGDGAREFALANGFVAENLLTDRARRIWLHWKRTRSTEDDWLSPAEDAVDADVRDWFGRYRKTGGTVHCAARDQQGNLGCTTSTSGHPFKLAGRVGDSPILGAGLYVDNRIGTCGSIGDGEFNQQHLTSFLAVELMRQGADPQTAGLECLRRIAEHVPAEKRDTDGVPLMHLQLFLLAADGRHAAVTMRGRKQYSVSDADGTRLEPSVPLFDSADGPA